MTEHWPPPEDLPQRDLYERIARGDLATGEHGTVVFVVFTDQLDLRRGDLYVALGMAKALIARGWGVRLLPGPKWYEPLEGPADVAIVMIESFVPGLLPPHVATVAWCRNWTSRWAALPYLDDFDAVWSSSSASAAAIESNSSRPVEVVPIGADEELFRDGAGARDIPVLSTANFWGEERSLAGALAHVSDSHRVVWVGGGSATEDTRRIEFPGSASYFSMPGLYRRSVLVVDDLIAPAKEFGNHNSRLFESISAGAVPITNERRALDELGLGEVPTYETGPDLAQSVGRLLGDPEGTARLAERLRAIVLSRHTFGHRAEQVHPSLLELKERASTRTERSALVRWIAQERVEKDAFLQRLVAEEARSASLEAQRDAEPATSALLDAAARRLVALPARVLRRLRGRSG